MRRQKPAAGLRREVRSRRWSFYRRAWPYVLGFWVVMLICVAGIVAVTPSDFASGALAGGFTVATLLLTDRIASEADGSWRFARGLDGEVWTADDLAWFRRRRRLRGERWRTVHSVGFHRGDVDHVLVGPGGVVALETKYRSVDVRWDEDRALHDAAAQVATGARRLQALIRQHTGDDVDVRPVIVTQGRGWTWSDAVAQKAVDGVPVLRGGQASKWEIDGGPSLSRAACRAIVDALDAYATQQLRASRDRLGR